MFLYIGAGVSTFYDVPDMKGFIKLCDEELHESQLYNDIRQFMGDKPNLEVLMTILSDIAKEPGQFWDTIAPYTAKFLMKNHSFMDKYLEKTEASKGARELLNHVQQAIFRTCIGEVANNLQTKVLAIYDDLLSTLMRLPFARKGEYQSGDAKVTYPLPLYIVTTNYDPALEWYWESRETQLNDGLEHDPIRKKYRLKANADLFKGEPKPALFKFHGSVNLFRKGTAIYRETVSVDEIGKIGIEGIIKKYGNLTLVYPVESTGRDYVTQSPYLDLYAIFRDKLLSETTRGNLWLILGTSLQDTTLCSAMEYCLSLRDSGDWPKIILLDRRASDIKNSLPVQFERLRKQLAPLDAQIEVGAEGFSKLNTLL